MKDLQKIIDDAPKWAERYSEDEDCYADYGDEANVYRVAFHSGVKIAHTSAEFVPCATDWRSLTDIKQMLELQEQNEKLKLDEVELIMIARSVIDAHESSDFGLGLQLEAEIAKGVFERKLINNLPNPR